MSDPKKKNQPIFLLGKLTLFDYLIILGVIVLLVVIWLLIPNVLNTLAELDSALEANRLPPQSVPARSVEVTNNVSQLWSKEEFTVPQAESAASLFFIVGDQTLVYTVENESTGLFTLEAHNIATGQTRWQTNIPGPALIRIYNDKIFVLSREEWSEQAPSVDNQELSYCSFWQSPYSLSAFALNTGEKIWSYGYRGADQGLYFQNQSVYLYGSDNHGNSRLVIEIDLDSGLIVNQRCGNKNDGTFPHAHGPTDYDDGISGGAFSINSIDVQCSQGNRYCFIGKENRLRILDGNAKEDLAYIEFGGAPLTTYYIDVLVHNNVCVIHLNDSDQLFVFRLP